MPTNEKPLKGIDLNLLQVFLIIFRERSVSRAAVYLSVSQPAVSGSLLRLRQCFGDPLFVRNGRTLQPTPKAFGIAALLMPAMQQIESMLSQNIITAERGAEAG